MCTWKLQEIMGEYYTEEDIEKMYASSLTVGILYSMGKDNFGSSKEDVDL